MNAKVFETNEVQNLLAAAANLGREDGNARAKEITHRLLSDLFKAIDDLDMTPDEIWAGVTYFNKLGQDGEAALLAAGLGLEKYLDIRMDAQDLEADIHGGTPRTIEGPLYVAGAPVRDGVSKIDINPDEDAGPLIIHGTVTGPDRKPVAGAVVECWHANSKGFYSHFDPTGEQRPFNMRRTIITDAQGRYKFRSIVPAGYGCPPDGPTQGLLNELGRHGNRPAHIHFFVTADGHRKLTTQINIDGDPLIYDDFAYATREGLVPPLVERTDAASIKAEGLEGPFAEIVFDMKLSTLVQGADNQIVDRPRLAA